jgi:hypothetical protein
MVVGLVVVGHRGILHDLECYLVELRDRVTNGLVATFAASQAREIFHAISAENSTSLVDFSDDHDRADKTGRDALKDDGLVVMNSGW